MTRKKIKAKKILFKVFFAYWFLPKYFLAPSLLKSKADSVPAVSFHFVEYVGRKLLDENRGVQDKILLEIVKTHKNV
jgi:hypothetical protein